MCGGRREHQCDLRMVVAGVLEQAVIDALMIQILTEDNLRAQLAAIEAERSQREPAIAAEIAGIERKVAEIARSIIHLVDALEGGDSPAISSRLREREAERAALLAQAAALRAELRGPVGGPLQVDVLRERLRQALVEGGQEARVLIRQIIAVIELGEGEATIKYRFPFGEPT